MDPSESDFFWGLIELASRNISVQPEMVAATIASLVSHASGLIICEREGDSVLVYPRLNRNNGDREIILSGNEALVFERLLPTDEYDGFLWL